MSNHKKIDWFRWHQRKMLIRINCAILSAILLIVLLLNFNIVSDAADYQTRAASKISDYFYINDFYLLDSAVSYYSSLDLSNLYHHATNDSYDYYDAIKYLVDEAVYNSNFTNSTKWGIFTSKVNSNELVIVFCNSFTFSYTRNTGEHPIVVMGSNTYYTYDIENETLSSVNTFGGSTSYVDNTLLGYFLCGNTSIALYNDSSQKVADNVNYLIDNDSVGFGEGGFDVSPPNQTFPDGSGGTDANNLYMRTADWKFNIPQYWPSVTSTLVQPAYVNRWGEGSISFYGLLNDYQKANASNFNLKFNFQIVCNGHYFSDTNSSVNGAFVGSFRYNDFTVPLSTFISNNNYATFSVSNLFTNATNGLNQTFSSYLDNIKGHNSINNWEWYVICDACIVANGSESGHCKEKYDFISQVSKETDYSITDNTNPYYPDDYDPSNQPEDNNGDDDNAKIINNNNDIININNNDKAVIDRLYDKLVPPDTVGEGGLTERFVNLTNANSWFQIMQTQLAILPAEFWTTVYTIFMASLGILGGAFLLWILAHIL